VGRAYPVECDRCGTRVTLLESRGRVGTSAFAPECEPVDDDDTVPRVLRLDDGTQPPCPACGEHSLRRDPNTTDICLGEDPPARSDTGRRRRRTDQLRAR
jgi:endogenous inhibitor of DNA gyrase (YacG/DUF329 family)